MTSRRFLPLAAASTVAASVVVTSALGLSGCSASDTAAGAASGDGEVTTVGLRLWDEQAAAAYEEAIPAFEEAHPEIDLEVTVVPWADYWTTLRTDIASDSVDDVFWTNSSNFVDYASAGALLDITDTLGADAAEAWDPNVVEQYSTGGAPGSGGKLWGVPQLVDPGVGVFYNKELLDAAGVTIEEVENLRWDPSGAADTLRDVAARLSLDSTGKKPTDAGFDPLKLSQFGYNAALDFQAITINYLGSNGATYQADDSDELTFASPEGVEAFEYIVSLITDDHVAPSAADTNDNADFSRDQFLQGSLALFQTGAYNLANIQEGADFEWGIAPLPEGPQGRLSVTNGIVAAASAESEHPEAQKTVLEWLAGEDAAAALGSSGAALPAVLAGQQSYFDYWEGEGVDVSPLVDVLENGSVAAPHGADVSKAFDAYEPILKEVYLGRTPVAEGVTAAEDAGNAVITK